MTVEICEICGKRKTIPIGSGLLCCNGHHTTKCDICEKEVSNKTTADGETHLTLDEKNIHSLERCITVLKDRIAELESFLHRIRRCSCQDVMLESLHTALYDVLEGKNGN